MASESQTTTAPSCSTGTRIVGEKLRHSGLLTPDSSTITSRNGAPDSFAASQPRSDQLE